MTSTLARLKAIIVYFPGPDATGTGYLVSSSRIATANHVVKSWTDGVYYKVLVGINHVTRRACVLKRDLTTDAALLGLDEPVDIAPLPIGDGLPLNVEWLAYGYPQSGGACEKPVGLPLDGLVKDPAATNNIGQPAVLLFSSMAAAGNASPLNGFSGSAVVVDDAIVGHLTKHIGDPDDLRRPRYGYVFACPINAVSSLFDFEPTRRSISALPITIEQYKKTCIGRELQELDDQVSSVRATALGELFNSLDDNLQSLIRMGDSASTALVDSCTGARLTQIAEAKKQSAYLLGARRSQAIRADWKALEHKAQILNQEIRYLDDLRQPIQPTMYSAPPFSELTPEQRMICNKNYLRACEQYERDKGTFQKSKAELSGKREQLFEIEERISQRRYESTSFDQSFEADINRLGKEVEVARSQDILEYLHKLMDEAKRDLIDEKLAARGFAKLLMCLAGSSVMRPWLVDSSSKMGDFLDRIGQLLIQVVQEFSLELGLDCLARCRVILNSLERNGATLQEIDFALKTPSIGSIDQALSEVRVLRALPIPSSKPPRSNWLRNNDQNIKEIRQAITDIDSIREQFRRYENLYAKLLEEGARRLSRALQLKGKMADEKACAEGAVNGLLFLWVELCGHDRLCAFPRDVFDFVAAVQGEVSRRHSLALGTLVEKYQKTGLLVNDADALINNSSTAVLQREYRSLSGEVGSLDELAAGYLTAMEEVSKRENGFGGKIRRFFSQK